MPQSYGSTLDYAIIAIYMVLIFGFGTLLARYNKTTKDFFMGGQRFGWWVIAMSLVATTVGFIRAFERRPAYSRFSQPRG